MKLSTRKYEQGTRHTILSVKLCQICEGFLVGPKTGTVRCHDRKSRQLQRFRSGHLHCAESARRSRSAFERALHARYRRAAPRARVLCLSSRPASDMMCWREAVHTCGSKLIKSHLVMACVHAVCFSSEAPVQPTPLNEHRCSVHALCVLDWSEENSIWVNCCDLDCVKSCCNELHV